jgi:hypothetical protein
MHFSRYSLPLVFSVWALSACGSSDGDSSSTSVTTAGDAQTPPTSNGNDVEAWLKTGKYEAWTCEDVPHAQMKVSPHGHNRVCVNDLIAGFTGSGSEERPKGSAAVKELYDDSDALVGYAVEVKLAAASDSGKNWYWYERLPLDSMAPPGSTRVVADGMGNAGAARDICVGCHAAAGSDGTHTVTKSSDFVYDVVH